MILRSVAVATTSALALAGAANAQLATPVGELVVTARREASASISGLLVDPLLRPQNVRVIDAELIEDLGATRIADIFNLSGVSLVNTVGGTTNNFAIRGFTGDAGSSDILINRFNVTRGFDAPRDVATVARFEVLKGPASALSGAGDPGGTINIVTKPPLARFHASAEASVARFDQYRGVVDVGGRVGGSGAVRLIVVGEDNGSFRDFVTSERLIVAPSIAFDVSSDLRLLYQYEYVDNIALWDRGVATIDGNAFALPRERFLGEPNDGPIKQRSHQHQGSAFLAIAPNVSVEAGVQYREATIGGFYSDPRFTNAILPPSPGGGRLMARDYVLRDDVFDDVTGRLELAAAGSFAGASHQLRLGVEAFRFDTFRRAARNTAANYGIDVFRPVYGQPKPALPITLADEAIEGEALYAQDLIQYGPFSLLLGIRQDWIRQSIVATAVNGVRIRSRQGPSATSPRLALTYAPSEQISFYASYGRSFRVNQGASLGGVGNPLPLGAPFAPQRGRAYEAGLKYALQGGRLTGTVSAYNIVKSNLLVNGIVFPGNTTFGEVRSRGVETDVNYRLGEQIIATGYYGYVEAETTADRNPLLVGRPLNNIPTHIGSAFVRWASNGDEPRSLSLAGGISYVGDRPASLTSVANVNAPFGRGVLPAYTTVQANVGYRLTRRLSAQMDVTNIFDEYVLESSNTDTRTQVGEPRSVRLTLRAEF